MIEKLTEYSKFIENCRNKVYTEPTHTHHILPKFMGGTDNKENLIELSVTDHTRAHIILAETCDSEFKNGAWWSVAKLKKGWNGDVEKILQNIRESVSGENNPFYGKKHTEESKRKMVESHPYPFKGKTYEEYYGKKKAMEMKKKISKSKLGEKNPSKQKDVKVSIINGLKKYYGNETNRINQSQKMKDYYSSRKGKDTLKKMSETIKNKPKIKCPHCDVSSNVMSNMKRWHFENCKNK